MSPHRRAGRVAGNRAASACAAAGVLALGVSMSAPSAVAAQQPTTEGPPRVTGVSNVLDVSATGSTLAVPLGYGVGTSAANFALAQLPPEAQPVTNQVLVAEAAGPQVFEAIAPGAKQFVDAGRSGIAPLAAFNEQSNAGITAISGGTRAAAEALGPVVQPGDMAMYQFADFLDALRAK